MIINTFTVVYDRMVSFIAIQTLLECGLTPIKIYDVTKPHNLSYKDFLFKYRLEKLDKRLK